MHERACHEGRNENTHASNRGRANDAMRDGQPAQTAKKGAEEDESKQRRERIGLTDAAGRVCKRAPKANREHLPENLQENLSEHVDENDKENFDNGFLDLREGEGRTTDARVRENAKRSSRGTVSDNGRGVWRAACSTRAPSAVQVCSRGDD